VGGAVMGDNPKTSALNKYLQSWDVHNVFVPGFCGKALPPGTNTLCTSQLCRYLFSAEVFGLSPITAFVPGGNAFPQNFQANPTDTIGAITLMAAQAIKDPPMVSVGFAWKFCGKALPPGTNTLCTSQLCRYLFIGAITLMAAQAIKDQYLKNPGPLVQA
jgi:ribosomal protein L24E